MVSPADAGAFPLFLLTCLCLDVDNFVPYSIPMAKRWLTRRDGPQWYLHLIIQQNLPCFYWLWETLQVALIAPSCFCMNSNFKKYQVEPRPSGIAGQGVCALRSFAAELHVKMSGTGAGHPEDTRSEQDQANFFILPLHPTSEW